MTETTPDLDALIEAATSTDAGEPAEKRVRKTRVAKPKDTLTVPPLEDAKPAPPPRAR